ncbi:hypothetical protein L210DRAFT_3534912 [Boletus edulis BED1]|uniref:Uncharacterized protein n=1 Tax=Boletus edulis BED1 TaxID=1328754 RepID=A0AAD4BC63_BOLED|nr:hypothetical protein L210DRAFT_3579724 [Boletus edulis BED1]KAF8443130.1 hypothetical protein L210DRAFT_3534912 [Boletus edulis BED1]
MRCAASPIAHQGVPVSTSCCRRSAPRPVRSWCSLPPVPLLLSQTRTRHQPFLATHAPLGSTV